MDYNQQDVYDIIERLRKRLPDSLRKIHREYVGRSIIESDDPKTSQAETNLDTIVSYVESVSVGSRVLARIDEVIPYIGAMVTLVATGERLPRNLTHLHMKVHVPLSRMRKIDKAMTNHIFIFDIINKVYPPEPELPTVDLELTIPWTENRRIMDDCQIENTLQDRSISTEKEQRHNISKIDWYAQRIGVPTRLVETCADLPIAPLSLFRSVCEPIELYRNKLEVFRQTTTQNNKMSGEQKEIDIINETANKKRKREKATVTLSPNEGPSNIAKKAKTTNEKKMKKWRKEKDEKQNRKADLEKLKNFHEMLKRAK